MKLDLDQTNKALSRVQRGSNGGLLRRIVLALESGEAGWQPCPSQTWAHLTRVALGLQQKVQQSRRELGNLAQRLQRIQHRS